MTTNASPASVQAWPAGRDVAWLALIAVVFAGTLAASWQRWADPIVDVGREMNLPLRLLNGEQLYSDVRHIYGPLSPLLHAALYWLLGPSLTWLYAEGLVIAVVMLGLVYWLGRQLMSPAAAAAATLNVLALCIFKPAGNYILPYSYNSLHGAMLGLVTLVLLIRAVQDPRTRDDHARQRRACLTAGGLCGLAILAKTEMGMAATVAGLAAAWAMGYPRWRRVLTLAVTFCAPAAVIAVVPYALLVARIGWVPVLQDSWLLLYNMPPEIAYFNGQISGLGRPARSLTRMGIAAAKLGIIACFIAALSNLIAAIGSRRNSSATAIVQRTPVLLLTGALVGLAILYATTGLDADKGPFLAVPPVLLVLLIVSGYRLTRQWQPHTATLVVMSAYAFASLTRILLHVRSGGAYASYLLPTAIVLFTYVWVGPFLQWLRDPPVARVARHVVLTLILIAGLANAAVLSSRYQRRNTVTVTTPRGAMTVPADMGQAINEALAFIDRRTRPDDAIAVLPEGSAITFLSGRRNPLREEILTPGYLDANGEQRAIRQLDAAQTALILIPNRPTGEFGPNVFGRDYDHQLMQWIETRYAVCGIFGPVKDPGLAIGDKPFFLRAYCAPEGDQR
ncbi:MAG: hypothetical protein ABIX28_00780 [Vicinamibacterales bacterium]